VKKAKEVENLKHCEKLLSKNKYSSEAVREIQKWYDYSEKKGIASFARAHYLVVFSYS